MLGADDLKDEKMLQRKAIDILASARGYGIRVATMQPAAPWHDAGQGEAFHIDASGCTGSAASLALGLAPGRPEHKVLALDSDGSLLMRLGPLVTAAATGIRNFYHFVFANGTYESSGNQPILGLGVFDFCALSRAALRRQLAASP